LTFVLGNDYHVYRILDIIAKREYLNLGNRYYKKHNIRHSLNYDGRGKRASYREQGFAASASAIKQAIGAKSPKKIHEDIMELSRLGLLECEAYVDESNRYANEQYWYKTLDLTNKGIRYLHVFESMLELVNYFDSMKIMI
jgi:SOS-response transcriptional repressor LexA